MRIIGLLGAAGSGKSTVSNWLVEKYGAKKYALADPLKEVASRVFEFSHDQMYGPQAVKEAVDPRYNFSPRWLLQRLGTEGIREVFGRDIWWKTCLERIMRDRPQLAVIEDVRFLNEVEGLLAINDTSSDPGGKLSVMIWRIESPQVNSTADSTHQSEAEWASARYTHKIAPDVYGMLHLVDAFDQVAMECELVKVSQPASATNSTDATKVALDMSPLCLRRLGKDDCMLPWGHEPTEECKGGT